jgi:hypothetical protein
VKGPRGVVHEAREFGAADVTAPVPAPAAAYAPRRLLPPRATSKPVTYHVSAQADRNVLRRLHGQ